MSGHSKWANIKRRKEAEDKKRGQIFSKIARAIVAAVKEGGSADPQANARLRLVLQRARAANMPKSNIERALQRGEKQGEALQNFVLEGYGPGGVAVMMEVLTDNRQRTIQEVRNLFQRHSGNLAEPGAVAFQFEKVNLVKTGPLAEEKILQLMDLGVADFEAGERGVTFYLEGEIEPFKQAAQKEGAEILLADQTMRAKNPFQPASEEEKNKVRLFLEELEEHEDIQRVFSNFHE